MSGKAPPAAAPSAEAAAKSTASPVAAAGTPVEISYGSPVIGVLLAIFYAGFASVSGALSQLTLAPVYGSLPSAAQHEQLLRWALLLAFLAKDSILQYAPPDPKRYLPVFAFYVPLIQWFLFRDSARVGVNSGPAATEVMTYFPIVVLSGICISQSLESISIYRKLPILQIMTGVLVWLALSYGEPFVMRFIIDLPSLKDLPIQPMFLSKVNLQLVLAALATPIAPSWMGFLSLPAAYHATTLNPHFVARSQSSIVNATLIPHGWMLLDRQESITGYVSVLENMQEHYRVLRCEHSLLGGEWLPTPERLSDGITHPEPIYSVFTTLEAVRLVQVPMARKAEADKKALVIGTGIGTAPKALLAHGLDTTIVELDPVVHEFAQKYFDLPTNHTAILRDAVEWVSAGAPGKHREYDYIIHDVFTGGAEPLELFTVSFLQNLKLLLSPMGVIAINYAGSRNTAPTKQVLNTIDYVFEGRCRIFRDLPAQEGASPDDDFSNMIVFCLNPTWPEAWRGIAFREPVDADYLDTMSRRHYLMPRGDLELQFPSKESLEGGTLKIMTESTVDKFQKEQLESARRHWKIMRDVLPAVVWETW